MIQRTQNCAKFNHPEFSLQCEGNEFFDARLKWLLEWLEHEVANNKRFLPEQTVQVGWSLLTVKQRGDGTLALFEPDFQSMPIKFLDGVSNTVLHLAVHKFVCESLMLEDELELSPLNHSAIVCSDFGKHKGLILTRHSPTDGNDSGWFFGCGDPSHNHQSAENLRRVSLYEAAIVLDDRIIPYLALPEGILISMIDSKPRFFLNEVALSIKPGSYLDQKLNQQRT